MIKAIRLTLEPEMHLGRGMQLTVTVETQGQPRTTVSYYLHDDEFVPLFDVYMDRAKAELREFIKRETAPKQPILDLCLAIEKHFQRQKENLIQEWGEDTPPGEAEPKENAE